MKFRWYTTNPISCLVFRRAFSDIHLQSAIDFNFSNGLSVHAFSRTNNARPSFTRSKAVKLVFAYGVGATVFALGVGGDHTLNRVLSLFQASPGEVYYSNRGILSMPTIQHDIPRFPLGAGLANGVRLDSTLVRPQSKAILIIMWRFN